MSCTAAPRILGCPAAELLNTAEAEHQMVQHLLAAERFEEASFWAQASADAVHRRASVEMGFDAHKEVQEHHAYLYARREMLAVCRTADQTRLERQHEMFRAAWPLRSNPVRTDDNLRMLRNLLMGAI